MNQKDKFVGFEYKEIIVKKAMQSLYADNFSDFGWIEDGIEEAIGKVDSIVMKFKRDRKITNRVELTRLQRQFEACVSEIVALEQSKVIKAASTAYVIGIVGTVFMSGSVFAVIAGKVALCILLAVPAVVGWISPYFIYKLISKKKTEELNPLIDEKYDELYEVCEKANALLLN